MTFRRLNRFVLRLARELQIVPPSISDWVTGTSIEVSIADRARTSEERIVDSLVCKLESADRRAADAAEVDLLAVGMPAGPVLVDALAKCSWAVRARIARVLGKLGCPIAIPALQFYFSRARTDRFDSWDCTDEQVETVADLLVLPERMGWERIDESVYFRIQVIGALYALRGPEAISALCEILADPLPEIQGFAAMALKELAYEEPCPALRSALPPLRRLVAGWSNDNLRCRRECRLAIDAIEIVTIATEQFPVPAGPMATTSQSLPLSHPHLMDAPAVLPLESTKLGT